jgi:hypothetical protein
LETLSTIPEWITLEHDVATILTNQELHGWYFDEPAARELAQALYSELADLNQLLRRAGTLSSLDRSLLLKDLTKHRDTSLELLSLD